MDYLQDPKFKEIIQQYTLSDNVNPISVVVQKDSASNRSCLLNLHNHELLQEGTRVVYIYSLVDETFSYPDGESNVVYIGEAYRNSEPTGKRFGQHIATGETQGADTGTNYTLTRFYYLGKKLRVDIFVLKDDVNQKNVESRLFQWHMKKYGSLPIAQGASGESFTLKTMNSL